MNVNFKPIRHNETLKIVKNGDELTVNEEVYDFSSLSDGHKLPRGSIDNKWIVGDVYREDGILNITFLLPHGKNASEETRYFESIINPDDGELDLPPYN